MVNERRDEFCSIGASKKSLRYRSTPDSTRAFLTISRIAWRVCCRETPAGPREMLTDLERTHIQTAVKMHFDLEKISESHVGKTVLIFLKKYRTT